MMLFIMLGVLLYVFGGVATFRRAGYAVKEKYGDVWRLVHTIGPHHAHHCYKGTVYQSKSQNCDCIYSYKRLLMPWTFLYSMLAWPAVVAYWGVANTARLYGRLTGEDLTFFVPAPRVKTTAELLAESEESRKRLEEEVKAMEKELLSKELQDD